MLCYEVWVNGEHVCVAGAEGMGGMQALLARPGDGNAGHLPIRRGDSAPANGSNFARSKYNGTPALCGCSPRADRVILGQVNPDVATFMAISPTPLIETQRHQSGTSDATGAGHSLGAGESFMTYELTIHEKPTYLHVIVTGWNSKENVKQYLEEAIRACINRGYFRVLIEERLDGPRLGTQDVFEIAAEGSDKARGLLKAIAYVDINAEGDLMRFAETVAVNRALPVVVFSSVAEAEIWLLSDAGGGAE
jgi:hypothetical protein